MNKISDYSMYSKYYDELNNDYSLWFSFIDSHINTANSTKLKLIEFGCGTGNVLERYKDTCKIYGVDISEEMLSQARNKIPSGTFYLTDMTTFHSKEKFDVVLCLFDSINHVLDFSNWKVFFSNVSDLLKNDGTFIIDINTTGRLSLNSQYPPMFKEFGENYFYMKLNRKDDTNFLFDVRVLRKIEKDKYFQEKEIIEETTRSGEEVFNILSSVFKKIKVFNGKQEEISESDFSSNEKYRWFFVCRK